MVSTTHCYKRAERRHFLSFALCCVLLSYPLLAGTDENESGPFTIRSVSVERTQQEYLLDSIVDFNLNPTVLEALHNGVSITLQMQIEFYREREWMWDKAVSNIDRHFRLRYFALSQLYLLTDLESQSRYSFASLNAALYRLGHMQTSLAPLHQVMAGQPHTLRMRILLDIEALPAPLRPLAYLSSPWRLKSKWYTWPIQI